MIIVLAWLLLAFIVAAIGSGREIGFGKALIISLLLSPLIGAIFVATSPTIVSDLPLPRDVQKLIDSADSKFAAQNYDGALAGYEAVLSLQREAPNTHFKIAQIHSVNRRPAKAFEHIAKAVEHGFDDYRQIMTSEELAYLRQQEGFERFSQQGYKLTDAIAARGNDTISQLERLAQLKAKGILTEEEFQEQKKKLLAS